MVTMKKRAVWCVILMMVILSGCAIQDDIYTLDHRLSALERRNAELEKRNRELLEAKENISSKVEGLNKTRQEDEFELRGQYAGLAAQIDSLREALQLQTGRLEELEYLLNQKIAGYEERQRQNQERLDRITTGMGSLEKRVTGVDRYPNPEDSQAQSKHTPQRTAVVATNKSASGEELYQSSRKKFDSGDYEGARNGFEKLIATYPKSSQADNAQFWIGETYYREKWYEKAILEYQKVIENYPSGNKIPAALLKQGLSFIQIGEISNARLLLKELIAKHPGTNEAKIATEKLKSL